jgi:hypothetical protein
MSILENNLLAHNEHFDSSTPTIKSKLLTADEEERFLNIPGMDQGVLPAPLDASESMVRVDVDDAMAYCECTHIPTAEQIDLSAETQHYIDGQTRAAGGVGGARAEGGGLHELIAFL